MRNVYTQTLMYYVAKGQEKKISFKAQSHYRLRPLKKTTNLKTHDQKRPVFFTVTVEYKSPLFTHFFTYLKNTYGFSGRRWSLVVIDASVAGPLNTHSSLWSKDL
jgi:hypothetical protein